MQLTSPIIITPRLLPGVRVGEGFVSIEYGGVQAGRQVYKYYIDVGPDSYSNNDLSSGVGGGTLQDGLSSLMSFLSACAESYNYEQRTGRTGENTELFPAWVAEWASANSDELSMLGLELEEGGELIQE